MGFSLVIFQSQEVTSEHMPLLSRAALGRAKWHAGEADAETLLDTTPSLLILLQGAGFHHTLVEAETGEVCQVHKHCDNVSCIEL